MPVVSVNWIEATWLVLNVVTLFLTVYALVDARADERAVRALNGEAREIVTEGNVRRETFRVILQVQLLFVALPGLFSDREATLNPIVLVLMSIPVVLLLATIFDARDRMLLARTIETARNRRAGDPK